MIRLCKIDNIFKLLYCLSCCILFFSIHISNTAFANVSTDGTVGPAQSLAGSDYQISHDLGTIMGQNLFHSFHDFSIAKGESATFTGPDSIANVISRVTGGEISSIDGLLRSEVGQADFFFINPAGVVFGPNAQVDVPGAFHVTTADELRFSDGNVFSSLNPAASSLTMAEPASFGFLSPQSASIVLNGAQLIFAPESTIGFAGGDVTIIGSESGEAAIVSHGGEIQVRAVGGVHGEVPISENAAFDMQGNIQLESAILTTSGNTGGKISIQAGDMTITSAIIAAENTGSDNPGDGIELLIDVTNHFSIIDSGVVSACTYGPGNAGDVLVKAGSLTIQGQDSDLYTGIYNQVKTTESTGHGGAVDVDVDGRLEILGNRAYISSTTLGQGDGGDISIQADSLLVDSNNQEGGIAAGTEPSASGDGGFIDINVNGLMEFLNGSLISNTTFSEGDAGDIMIHAGDILIAGSGIYPSGFHSDTHGKGNGGKVDVSVDGSLEILNGAYVSSSTSFDGNAGSVVVNAGELSIDGQTGECGIRSATIGSGDGGIVDIYVSGLMEVINGGLVSSDTFGTGDAGSVNVSVDGYLEIRDGGVISSSTWGAGDGGLVNINAGNLRIDTQSTGSYTGIYSEASVGSTGNARQVEVHVGERLEIIGDNAWISSGTFSQGDGGEVFIQADSLFINGMGGIYCPTTSSGLGGSANININGLMELINGGIVLNSSYSQGDAGDITIHAGDVRISGIGNDIYHSGFQNETFETGHAGNVKLSADGCLELLNGGTISAATNSAGNAGNVAIESSTIKIDGESTGVLSRAKHLLINEYVGYVGHVGNISIIADEMSVLNNGEVSIASTGLSSDLNIENITDSQKGSINIDVNRLLLDQNAQITAESDNNVPAAAIDLNVRELVVKNISSITTSAQDANGGPITIRSDTMILRDALITTSVDGLSGDGGTIVLTGQGSNPDPGILLENLDNPADVMVFDGGFVQANTAAPEAHGGDILINARAVIASDDQLSVGEEERMVFEQCQGLNVIQAAAEGGEQGTINITAPELDISGSLVQTTVNFFQPARLATDPCSFAAGQGKSSLILDSQGRLQINPEYPLDLFWGQGRLDMMLK